MTNLYSDLKLLLKRSKKYYVNNIQKISGDFNIKKIQKVFLFGAAQMGKIYVEYLNNLGIEIIAYCDNDKTKIGKNFMGRKIISFQELRKQPSNIPVIITSKFNEIKKQLNKKGFKKVWLYNFLATQYPNKFYDQHWSNSLNSIFRNKINIKKTFNLFEDFKSKKVFIQNLKRRLFFDRKFIKKVSDKPETQYFDKKIMSITENEIFIDGGAFDGDTIRQFIKYTRNKYKLIFAFEPDTISFKKLNNWVIKANDYRIKIYKYGIGSKKDLLKFSNDGSYGSRISKTGPIKVRIIDLDKFLLNKSFPTIIKLDIEGFEKEAVIGMKHIIKKCKPKLAVCVYHRPTDLWEIPMLIKKFNPKYKIYLRHYTEFNTETVCYAV